MPDDDAKDKSTDDLDEAPTKAERPARAIVTTDTSKSSAATTGSTTDKPKSSGAAPAKAKPKAKPVVEEPDEDDEDDEEWDDEDEDEDEPPPPPKKVVKAKAVKGKTAPARIVKTVAAKRADPPTLHNVAERLPPKHYIPYALGGMCLLALHVYKDFDYQPVAVAGIALCIWAYMGIGSANEIKTIS